MGRPAGRSVSIEFSKNPDAIFTARAGLVPVSDVVRKTKLAQRIDAACDGVRNESYTDFKSSQLVLSRVYGHLSGFHRTHHLLTSSELPFIAKLVNFESNPPADTTYGRFYEGFEEQHIDNMKAINFDLSRKKVVEVEGFEIFVHDQSAIQKYGKQMEGVEKGYGGTLKRGSYMLQCSMITDVGLHMINHLDIRPGSTHSNFGAAGELDGLLTKLPEAKPGKRLILGDSAYGIGDYMRTCDEHNANFILAVKNDKWMKDELAALDFQRFKRGEDNSDYGYREFTADRKAWNGTEPNDLFGDDWDGTRRVVVVRLPTKDKDDPKFQFLITSFAANQFNAEDVHGIYRRNRESIEQINDEMKNQMGLTALPSQNIDANRAIAQVIALAWNLQRHVEHVGMETERKEENARRPKAASRKGRYEWWTMFVRFISVGGKLSTHGNKFTVIVSWNEMFKRWLNNISRFDWRAYALMR